MKRIILLITPIIAKYSCSIYFVPIFLILLFAALLLAGCECGWEYEAIPARVKLHSLPPDKSKDVPYLIIERPKNVELFIDSEKIIWDSKAVCAECVVKIELMPGRHVMNWSYDGIYKGEGVLNAQYKGVYLMCLGRAFDSEFVGQEWKINSVNIKRTEKYDIKKEDVATYIEDVCTHEVVLGRKPNAGQGPSSWREI